MESCATQFGQKGKEREREGYSLKRFAVYILRGPWLCQKSKEKGISRKDGYLRNEV